MTCQEVVKSRQQKLPGRLREKNHSGFIINISKQLAFETKNLAGLTR